MNEAMTRSNLILPALQKAGWNKKPYRIAEEQLVCEIAPGRIDQAKACHSKPKRADYILMNGRERLAVVEAKSDEKPASAGDAQARHYAECLGLRFAFATNGREVVCIDLQLGTSRTIDISSFPSPRELLDIPARTKTVLESAAAAVPWSVAGNRTMRYYQERAVESAIKAIGNGQKRVLLTLATGTGKTFIAFQLCHKLLGARWRKDGSCASGRKPRILFLADRNILADQAKESFVSLGQAAYRLDSGVDKPPLDRDVYFTIYQTLFGKGENDDGAEDQVKYRAFARDFFDLVIIDECHRGGVNDESRWRTVLEYFTDAVHVGLTATPKRDDNNNTYEYFGNPVYVYSLKQGIEDGYLTSYRVKRCHSTLEKYLKDEDDKISNPDAVEDDKEYDTDALERALIEIRERDRHFVEELFDVMPPREKTLVFCVTQEHALRIRDAIREVARERVGIDAPHYCERVTAADGQIGEDFLRLFRKTEEENPAVLVSSRKLTTGVDALDVRSIVLLKSVKSMVEFKQIVGRGTRTNEGKGYFTIYDFTGATEQFKDPEWDGEVAPAERPERPEKPDKPEKPEPQPCPVCGCLPCICEKPPREKTIVKLSSGRVIAAEWTESVFFDDEMITARDFLERFCRVVKSLVPSAEALKDKWRSMDSRAELLAELAARGFGEEKLREIQNKTERKEYDILDITLDLVYAVEPVKREMRANRVEEALATMTPAQASFARIILKNYVADGVWTLNRGVYLGLANSRYGSVVAAQTTLGDLDKFYTNLQNHLYAA